MLEEVKDLFRHYYSGTYHVFLELDHSASSFVLVLVLIDNSNINLRMVVSKPWDIL